MKRILTILGEPIVKGGQESFILNMYNNMDQKQIGIDIVTPFHCENKEFVENIKKNGGKVYIGNLSFEKNRKKNFVKYIKEFFTKYSYQIVHIQSGSIYELMMGAKIAKQSGVKKIIVHSHCGGDNNLKYRVIKNISEKIFLKNATDYWACSNLAANWKFPKQIINENKYVIMKNAIDTSCFFYDKDLRHKKIKELNLEGKYIIGHIGRFSYQKNHVFLIDIFNEIQKSKNNAVLLLIGTGELKEEIELKVKHLNLSDKVIFLGIRNDINELLNAMDAFVLPSNFEGLPVVGVEAQATGLQVFTSDQVTKELPIEDLSFYYSLSEPAKAWAANILKETKIYNRRNTTNEIIDKGYDVKEAAKRMQDYYLY